MTYLNTFNPRRNGLNWPSSFGVLEKQLDSLFSDFPSLLELESASADQNVKLRWYQKDDGYLARLDLPGVRKDDISLQLEESYLEVKATRSFEGEGDESRSLDYRKRFKVPEDVDTQAIVATYEDGVLSLSLPKGEKAKPQQIKVG